MLLEAWDAKRGLPWSLRSARQDGHVTDRDQARHLTYSEWCERLGAYLFDVKNRDQLVTLFVDDELTDRLFGGPDGAKSLASAVGTELGQAADHFFGGVYDDWMTWRAHGAEGYPRRCRS